MKFRDYSKLTPEETVRDINAAWDRIKILQANDDRKQQKILLLEELLGKSEKKRENAEIKLWIVSAALVALWEVAKFLILHH